jgi:hypothetical protein
MNRFSKIGLVIAVCVVFVGCASTPSGENFSTPVTAPQDKSVLYIYRLKEHYGGALQYSVMIDGEKKGDVGNGGYIVIPTDPGKHTIKGAALAYSDVPLEAAFNSGNYFIRMITKAGIGGFSATLSFELVNEAVALKDLPTTKREAERFIDDKL